MEKTMDKIIALAKARGFVYPGSEIYGGLANTWDYGNLGGQGQCAGGRGSCHRQPGVFQGSYEEATLVLHFQRVSFPLVHPRHDIVLALKE